MHGSGGQEVQLQLPKLQTNHDGLKAPQGPGRKKPWQIPALQIVPPAMDVGGCVSGAQVAELGQLVSSEQYAAALRLLLATQPPSADWPASGASPVPLTPAAPVRASSELLPTAQGLDEAAMWDAYGVRLHSFACKALRQLHPEISLALVHKQLLEHAAQPGHRADHATWWRLPAASDPQQSSLLMAAVFHLSSGPDIAWGCLSHALWHGMASTLPLQLGTPDTAKRWLPASAPRRIADLEASQGRWVRAALSKAARSATLEAALLATARQSLPRTYLQLVGQRLLSRWAQEAPGLLQLPQALPPTLLSCLVSRPWAEAVRLAFAALLEAPDDASAPFLPYTKASREAASRGFRRIYPLGDPAAVSSSSAAGGHSFTGGSGASFTGGGRRAPGPGRLSLAVLASISRDCADFERGLLAPLEAAGVPADSRRALLAVLRADVDTAVSGVRGLLAAALTATMSLLDLERALGESSSMAAAVPAPGGGAQAPDPDLLGGPMWGSEAGERQLLAAERRASATGIMDAGPLAPGRQLSSRGTLWHLPSLGAGALGRAPGLGRLPSMSVSGSGAGPGLPRGGLLLRAGSLEGGRSAGARHLAQLHSMTGQGRAGSGSASGSGGPGWAAGMGGGEAGAALVEGGGVGAAAGPLRLAPAPAKVLEVLDTALGRLQMFLPALQSLVVLSCLEVLQTLMDALAAAMAAPISAEGLGDPGAASLLALAAALGVQRRLVAWRPALDLPPRDGCYWHAQASHAACLAQASCLLDGLQQACCALHTSTLLAATTAALDAGDWASPRPPPVFRGAAAGPSAAAACWAMQLQALVHNGRQVLAPPLLTSIVGQVATATLATLVPAYARLRPSPARLPWLHADAGVLAATAWQLCQPGLEQRAPPVSAAAAQQLSKLCQQLCERAAACASSSSSGSSSGQSDRGEQPAPAAASAAWQWVQPELVALLEGLQPAQPSDMPFDPGAAGRLLRRLGPLGPLWLAGA